MCDNTNSKSPHIQADIHIPQRTTAESYGFERSEKYGNIPIDERKLQCCFVDNLLVTACLK